MDGTTSKVKNGRVGESKNIVPAEVRAEFNATWNEEITNSIGVRSYEDLQKELMM
jgi:hypothetical protein